MAHLALPCCAPASTRAAAANSTLPSALYRPHDAFGRRADGVPHSGSSVCAAPQGSNVHRLRLAPRAQVAKSRFQGSGSQDEDVHESKLGPGVISSVKDLDHVKWVTATVMRNDAVNLDGSVRLLHLSVPDHVDMLYGRRVKGVPDSTRWIDAYTLPGQSIGVRLADGAAASASGASTAPPKRLHTIASSPYASRRDSAYVDASIIEIMVERGGAEDEAAISELGPGAQVEVTQVIGRGFAPLLGSYNGVLQAIEEGRSLLIVGLGTRGAAPLRALLNWQPVLAHASGRPINALVVAQCPSRAAFLAEWDNWREAGIKVRPLYTEPAANTADSNAPAAAATASWDLDASRVSELLEVALFASEGGFEGVCGGSIRNVSVLLSGFPGALAGKVAKQISSRGVDYERILFCDYF